MSLIGNSFDIRYKYFIAIHIFKLNQPDNLEMIQIFYRECIKKVTKNA